MWRVFWTVLVVLVMGASSAWAQLPALLTDTRDGLTFHYEPRYEAATLPMRERASADLARLADELGYDELQGIQVWVLKDIGEYFERHNLPNTAPKWAAGISLSNQSTVVIQMRAAPGTGVEEFETTFHHELVHVALDRAAGGRGLPRWFHEGFAIMHADEWSADKSEMLSRAAAQGALTPFNELTARFPEHHNSASLAYAQSFHFVREWKTRYGDDVYARVLERVREGELFHQAFRNVTDDSVAVAEARWLQDLKNASSLWSLFNDGALIFFGASLLFLVAWWTRRNRNARKLRSMDSDTASAWDYDESAYPLPGERPR